MLIQVAIESKERFYFEEFKQLLGIDDIVLAISPDGQSEVWGFYREKLSTTMIIVERVEQQYILSMDMLASYDGYFIETRRMAPLSVACEPRNRSCRPK